MKTTLSTLSVILLSLSAHAQNAMEGIGAVITLSMITLISVLVLLVSSIIRLTKGKNKASMLVNVSGAVSILCSVLSMAILRTEIDSGFLTTCLGIIFTSTTLIVLNQRVGRSKNEDR
ncbi:MAG: hypothetical protein EP346_00295 [Bacteroidetes bacterium]|nr:MAG: hypothetical protein EP346_00295 [Bacteroidota bacterium]